VSEELAELRFGRLRGFAASKVRVESRESPVVLETLSHHRHDLVDFFESSRVGVG
jgi:hypothetical protein